MKGSNLGEFEELVMLTIAVLNSNAYGVSIKEELQQRAGRKVSISALHAALHRLEQKGFLESYFGESTKKRGGKRKKLFTITAMGIKTMDEVRNLRDSMWKDIKELVIQSKI